MMRQLKQWLHRKSQSADGQLSRHLLSTGLTLADWQSSQMRPVFFSDLTDARIAELKADHPEVVARLLDCATAALQHRFNLLGSGYFQSHDPDRPDNATGYKPIDWTLDPVRQLRFPRGIPHKEWDLYRMRPGNADIKHPWELARCQHWVWLGQAYRVTGEARYAQEIFLQLDDFMAANPVGRGINWTCTMDVALRALNWAIALSLIQGCGNEAERSTAVNALYEHGVFIRDNLEDKYEVTSNHYLSNVLGLLFLGRYFQSLPAGAQWYEFACAALEREIDIQVLPDGADFESSVPYHRLVLELFLTGLRLTDFAGTPLSDHYRSRVYDMALYHWSVLRPDGRMPQIGDADDGRAHIFLPSTAPDPQDGRHILGPAAAIFQNPQWLLGAGKDVGWEAGWWGLSATAGNAPLADVTMLFPDAGVFVSRRAQSYIAVTNSIVGTKGFGNHKHNDQLGFEFFAQGRAWLVDPGSYVYTGDPAARNRFRATAAHNTVIVDGEEQNHFNPEWLFRMFDPGFVPTHVSWSAEDNGASYTGRHSGYRRCPSPVEHERIFRLIHEPGVLLIADRLRGRGVHSIEWNFQCGPGVTARSTEQDVVWLEAGGQSMALCGLNGLEIGIGRGAYSPSYGVISEAPRLRCASQIQLGDQQPWCFVIAPPDWLQNEHAASVIAEFVTAAKEAWG